ncbi:MAG: hypothetical protein HOF44_10155, partial [Pelagibacterales bacterium]|nr:hypothetical protein [Pelagibacterales bacterium]
IVNHMGEDLIQPWPHTRYEAKTIARELGIALGLTNSYFKKCINKGLVKIKQVPANRYAYYLTPRGFSEKSRLTAEYLKASFDFYGRAKNDLKQIMAVCIEKKMFNIVLSDQSELAEIAIIISFSTNINLVGIIGKNSNKNINGIPIKANIKLFKKFDKVIITNVYDAQSRYDELSKTVSINKIIVPDLLKIKNREGR